MLAASTVLQRNQLDQGRCSSFGVERSISSASSSCGSRARSRGHHRFSPLTPTSSSASSRGASDFFVGMMLSASIRRERRWWAIHRSEEDRQGFWERKVQGLWHRTAETYADPGEADDYLDSKYVRAYRVDHATFTYLMQKTRVPLTHETTAYRVPIAPEKRLAITLAGTLSHL